ncbi:MAG: flavodoxin domain-containing protein [Candidatus Aminicenantes bacterium]
MEVEKDIRVLVAFATKYGATEEIAEKIGQVLRQEGLSTDVLPVDKVKDLSPYKAVVVGSAVYVGQWRKNAAKFLKSNEKTLTERNVWLFSSGPTGEGDPVELANNWHFPKTLQPVADRIQPKDITLFHGFVDMNLLNPLHKWMINKVDAPMGDFRDWEAVTSWATSIADALKKSSS